MTYLSPEAMRDARKFMASDQQGVRDEIGFLAIHQRYAERFFPGTSVLHTRLRYALFVPWLYRDEQMRPSRTRRTTDSIKHREYLLTGRLRNESFGVIGGRSYPDPIEQRPSQVYWGSLYRWGILRGQQGAGAPSRHQVERMITEGRSTTLTDDEGVPLSGTDWPFSCPEPPDEWRNEGEGSLSFRLLAPERTFLAKQLRGLYSPDNAGEKSILGRLVGKNLSDVQYAWSEEVTDLAGAELPALTRAGQAAALSAVGRAIYAAQVETLRDETDRNPTTGSKRNDLLDVARRWGPPAAELDWDSFVEDMESLPGLVSEALSQTLAWVRAGKSDPMALQAAYQAAEEYRKGRRARLSLSQFGVDLRTDWVNTYHPRAEPLHYRWFRIQSLLADLVGA